MIGLDTNLLVRFITQDEPEQSALANDLMLRRLTPAEPGFVNIVVVVELAWVLERAYRLDAGRLAAVIERLLQAENLVVESEAEVFLALVAVREGRGSFADALITARNRRAGCGITPTLDRAALRLPGFAAP